MKQIIKRLEQIIKSIELGDQDIMEMQILKLKELGIDDNVSMLIEKLQNGMTSEPSIAIVKNSIQDYIDKCIHSSDSPEKVNKVQNFKRKRGFLKSVFDGAGEVSDGINSTLNSFNKGLNIVNQELKKNLVESKKEHIKFLEKQLNEIIKSDAPKEMAKYILNIDLKDEDIEQWKIQNNKEVDKLQSELNLLEEDLLNLSEKKFFMLADIEEFTIQYYLRLGRTMENIMELKQKTIKQQVLDKEHDFEEEDRKKDVKENSIHKEYEVFHTGFKQIVNEDVKKKHMSVNEFKVLKNMYKEATRFCHPDIVENHFKEEAQDIMAQLNDACMLKIIDIDKVEISNLIEKCKCDHCRRINWIICV